MLININIKSKCFFDMVLVGWLGEDVEFIMYNVFKGRGYEFDFICYLYKLNIN